MTAQNPPSFMQGVATEVAAQGRLLLQGLEPYQGCVLGADLAVTGSASIMQVTVASGGAFIAGTQSGTQGSYHVFNDAAVNLTVAASDVTNPRWDIVTATVRDSQYSGGNNDWLM